MIPYFVFLFGVAAIAFASQHLRLSSNFRRVLLAVVILTLALFAGLRADSVGVDTSGYIERLEMLRSSGQIWDLESSVEPGVKVIYAAVLLLGGKPSVFLLLSSLLAATLYILGLQKSSRDLGMSLFLFVSLGFFVFHMNGLRQGLALGFYMMAYPKLVRGEFRGYALWVGVAALFHISAIFTLPLYFLFRQGFSLRHVTLLILICSALVLFMDEALKVAGFFNERYYLYSERTETGGLLLTTYYVLQCMVFIFARPFIRGELKMEYDLLLSLSVFGAAVFLIVSITESYVEMTRFSIYFLVSAVLLWPILIKSIPDSNTRVLSNMALLAIGGMFYYLYLGKIGGYVPYVLR